MKKILILGGTQFIGRNLVERLLEMDKYEITLFNRQITQPDLFSGTNKIKGDRETDDVNQIADRHWDYVIDVSCFYPDSLVNVLNCLNNVGKYILISTSSVYDNENNFTQVRNEQSKILSCNNDQRIDRTTESYGNRKAECERILQDSGFPYIILRPALVYGEFDHSDRLYYWLYQVKHNDILLLPDNGEHMFSITYVHDLVETIIQSLIQNTSSNTYNVITVPKVSIRKIVDQACLLLDKDVTTINAPVDFLNKNKVSQWTDMPIWIDGDYCTYNNQKLKDDLNIKFTEFEKSIKATINYYDSMNWQEPKYGMTEKRRQELIKNIKTIANKK